MSYSIFSKWGDQPLLVHRIAGESSTQLIEDPACGHPLQGEAQHGTRARRPWFFQQRQEVLKERLLGEFGRSAEPAVCRVEGRADVEIGLFQKTRVGDSLPGGDPPSYHRGELGCLLRHQVSLFPPRLRYRLQHLGEGGHPSPRPGRVVGSGVEGFAIGVQENSQRPSSPAGEHLAGLHVDGVDVRSLFAVHLDVDEQPVHYLGRGRILEGLVSHHMAPVTG